MNRWLGGAFGILVLALTSLVAAERPNIVWIISEDASPHIGPYGATLIKTPNLDRMAAEGVLFKNAFVTNPVCSPSRSALVAGMYQTTLGAHNHRSANRSAKAGGNVAYYESYRVPASIELIPELFTKAGYYVVNGGKGKTDYNFIARTELYRGREWEGRAEGQPFFAQVQLAGGKNRRAKVSPMTDPSKVKLPPYYPDVPQMREDWAQYLNSWVAADEAVGEVFERLEREGVLDSTAVFFITDHGISHLRGKQFLYDEGIHVPLLVRLPGKKLAGTVRRDLVSHIDVSAASLELAGLPIPDYVQGRPLFAPDHQPRRFVFAARDRCDETVDTIRALRTARYKYIRNFRFHRSHMQPNQYKYGKQITKTMFALHEAGKLNELQDRIFAERRPVEELYDLETDPYETVNLAAEAGHEATVRKLRAALYRQMVETRDLGMVPEPILEDLGKKYGSKYEAAPHVNFSELIAVADAGAWGRTDELRKALGSKSAAVRYWAAIGLGLPENFDRAWLERHLGDVDATVRVAAALGLARNTDLQRAVSLLGGEIKNENRLVGLYAIRAIEELGERARAASPAVVEAIDADYNPTQRIALRLARQWKLAPSD